MRIYGPNGSALAAAPAASRRAASGGFSVSEDTAARGPAPGSGLRSVSSVDALIALQGVEDAAERKKRAVKQGRHALDVLDTVKLSLLDGSLDPSTLGRLKAAAEELKGGTGDSGLDSVLGEIALRVEVEMAKAGIR